MDLEHRAPEEWQVQQENSQAQKPTWSQAYLSLKESHYPFKQASVGKCLLCQNKNKKQKNQRQQKRSWQNSLWESITHYLLGHTRFCDNELKCAYSFSLSGLYLHSHFGSVSPQNPPSGCNLAGRVVWLGRGRGQWFCQLLGGHFCFEGSHHSQFMHSEAISVSGAPSTSCPLWCTD